MPQSHSDWWRDYVVAQVRNAPINSKSHREFLARLIERHWRSDPKFDRRIGRSDKARAIRWQLKEMTANMSVAEAKEILASQHHHNSAEALDKWLRRNRLGLRRPTHI